MRHFMLALGAMSLAVPATMVLTTTEQAQAQSHHKKSYKYREWRGRDGRMYCRKKNGTTGLVIGAAGGALLGRAVDTRGERTTGTVLGAVAGALAGREIARNRSVRHCR
jgi:outer membrane lipoprotein SlyB